MTTFKAFRDANNIFIDVASEKKFPEWTYVSGGIYSCRITHPISDGNKIYIRAGHYIHIDKTLKGYQVSITKNQRVLNTIIL